jgi:hypothetical protein
MKRIIAVTVVAVSVAVGSSGCGTVSAHRLDAASAHTPSAYTCPMHPGYHTNHPGDCPICGMHLEPEPGGAANTASRTKKSE